MRRAAVIAFAAGFLAVQICCAPPLRAAAVEAAEPIHCPIQKQECEATKKTECEAGPQFVAEFSAKTKLSLGPSSLVVCLPDEPQTTNDQRPTTSFWSSPTRTIQLRI